MKFEDQVGKEFDFYGVCFNEFKLDTIVWEAIEDDDDGYRSYMDSVEVKDSDGIFFNAPLAKVRVEERSGSHDEIYVLVDVEDSHVWLEFGTEDVDDWYPGFVFRYNSKSL